MYDDLIAIAFECGAMNVAIINAKDIVFSEEVRVLCEKNYCGKYNTNWMCPPALGELEELEKRVLEYKRGLVIQTVSRLEDSFDVDGMDRARIEHFELMNNIRNALKEKYAYIDLLLLGAGACPICIKCAYIDDEPCRFPDRAMPSIEGYGIDVMSLTQACNIPYNNGVDTVSYIGMILFTTEETP